MRSLVFVVLLSVFALVGIAGCASQVDHEDRTFFYDRWKHLDKMNAEDRAFFYDSWTRPDKGTRQSTDGNR